MYVLHIYSRIGLVTASQLGLLRPSSRCCCYVLSDTSERHCFGRLDCLNVIRISPYEDVPLVELCTLCLHACQVRVTVGDSGLCCCICVTYFERYWINSLVCWSPASVLPLSSRLALTVKSVVFELLFSTGTASDWTGQFCQHFYIGQFRCHRFCVSAFTARFTARTIVRFSAVSLRLINNACWTIACHVLQVHWFWDDILELLIGQCHNWCPTPRNSVVSVVLQCTADLLLENAVLKTKINVANFAGCIEDLACAGERVVFQRLKLMWRFLPGYSPGLL